jgi:hypothetical protein
VTVGADNLWSLSTVSRAPAAASNNSPAIDTTNVSLLRLDWNIVSFSGGTTPSLSFVVDVLGADGLWYPVYTLTPVTAAEVDGVNLGPATATPAVLTKAARVRSVFGGAVVADSIVYGLSLVGRN